MKYKRSKRSTRITRGTLGAAALGFLGLGVLQLTQPTSAKADGAAEVLTIAEASSVTSAFAGDQTAEDRLPDFLVDGPQQLEGVVPSTTRLLGVESSGTRAWAALNQNNEACLVSLLPGVDQWASMTCATPVEFSQSALSLQAATTDAAARLYFVPEGYAAPALEKVGPQLFAGDPLRTEAEPVVLTPSGGNERVEMPVIEVLPFESTDDLLE